MLLLTHTRRGIFGLNNQQLNFSTLGNETTDAFLTTLKNANKIPSLSWSYTAGAKYRKCDKITLAQTKRSRLT